MIYLLCFLAVLPASTLCCDNKPDPNDCSKYILDCGSRQWTMPCAPGTLFDPVQKQCNHAYLVTCNTSPGVQATTEAPRNTPPAPSYPSQPPPAGNSLDNDDDGDDPCPGTDNVDPGTLSPPRPTPPPGSGSNSGSNPATVGSPITRPSTAATEKPTSRPSDSSRINTASGEMKSVCYFTNWAVYRPSPWTYKMDNVDPKLCTHLIYAFTKLENNRITVFDPNADTDQHNFYKKAVNLQNQGVIPMIAIGGWTDSAGTKYGTMLSTPQNRATLIDSVLKFLDQYGFQGLDLDYEYPACPQNGCSDQAKSERSNFSLLVKELRAAFEKKEKSSGHKLWLTAAVSANPNKINQMYEITELNKHLDFINLMAYDLSGAWESKAGHQATLNTCGPNDAITVDSAVKAWMKAGMDSRKIVLGVPTYGRAVKLSTNDVKYGAPTSGAASKGRYTREDGFWSFYEICNKVKSEGFVVEESTECPYAHNVNVKEWVSFDGPQSVRQKAAYIKDLKLGGSMIWTLDLDDFRGDCCNVMYPLLGILNAELRGVSGYDNVNCGNLK